MPMHASTTHDASPSAGTEKKKPVSRAALKAVETARKFDSLADAANIDVHVVALIRDRSVAHYFLRLTLYPHCVGKVWPDELQYCLPFVVPMPLRKYLPRMRRPTAPMRDRPGAESGRLLPRSPIHGGVFVVLLAASLGARGGFASGRCCVHWRGLV